MALQAIDTNEPHLHCGNTPENRNIFNGGGTVCGWFYADDFGQNGTGRLISKAVSASPSDGWMVYLEANDIVIGKGFSTANGFWETSGAIVTTGQWHFWAVVYNALSASNNPTVWFDDQFVSVTETDTPSGSSESDAAEELVIFNTQTIDRAFNGREAEVRLFDRELTAEELADIKAGNGKDSILLNEQAHYEMKEGAKNQIAFPTDLFRGSRQTEKATTTNSFVNVLPEDEQAPQEGDLMISIIVASGNSTSNNGTAPNLSTPSTWNKRNTSNTDMGGSTSRPSVHAYTKVASDSEPDDYTFNITNMSCDAYGGYLIFKASGLTTTPETVPAVINTGENDTPICPSVSISSDSLVIRIFANDDDDEVNVPLDSIPIIDVRGDGPDSNGSNLKVHFEVLTGATTGSISGDIPNGTEFWGCLTMTFEGATTRQLTDTAPTKDSSVNQNHGIPDGRPELPRYAADDLKTGVIV